MEYSKLANFYRSIEKTTKRLEKADILAGIFKDAGKDLKDIIYLAQGKVFPLWDERKIGFSSKLMIKAIASVYGISAGEVEKLWSGLGDLGKVAEHLADKRKQATLFSRRLAVRDVIENIRKLSSLEGEGTVNRKLQLVKELLSNASGDEVRYVVGTILEELRIGVAAGIVRDAIAKAFDADVNDVEASYDLLVDYGEVAELARGNRLESVKLEPGRPTHVMLAVLVKDINEGFERVGKPCQVEHKYDGFRLQCHKKNSKITLFTRRMEDVTNQFPDIAKYVKENVSGNSFILDSEAVGYNWKTGKYMPFQSMSQRIKRKYNIEEMAKKFPVELNVFDLVYYNGKSLFDVPLRKRREILEKIVKEKEKKIVLTRKLVSGNEKEVDKFYKEALNIGHEGVMFKSLDASYKPGRYVGYMAKMKPILETLDLVIVGAEWGEGKRAKWLSSYTVACADDDGNLVEVGKVSTGVKEKGEEGVTFAQITDELKPLITEEKGREVKVRPRLVVEVAYEEIQKSPTYTSGFALRFPRILKLRSDRGITDINSLGEVIQIYNIQRGRKTK